MLGVMMVEKRATKQEVRVFLPPAAIEVIDRMINEGIYTRRSEVIRDLVLDALHLKGERG